MFYVDMNLGFLPVKKFKDIQARIPTVPKLVNKKENTDIFSGPHKFLKSHRQI